MSKWKLEIKAPFLGIASNSHRTGILPNDYWQTYGEPNQSQNSLTTWYDCSNPNYLAPSPKPYDITGASTTDLIKYITDYTIPYQSVNDAAYAIGKSNLYYLTSYGITSLRTVTDMTDGQSLIYFANNLYYFYNRSASGNIGKFNLNATYDDTWASTVSGGTVAILEVAPHPVTSYKAKMIFGNGRYLGTSDGTTVTTQYIDYGAGSQVSDVAVSGSYLYIAVVFPALGTKKRTIIYKYDALLAETDPLDFINVKDEVTAIRVVNGIPYVFYGDYTYTSILEGHLSYISGSQIVHLKTFKGLSPLFYQVSEYKGYIAFLDNYYSNIYLYGSYDTGVNPILFPLINGSNTSIGCLANPFKGLMWSSKLITTCKLNRLPYADIAQYYQYSVWLSIAQIVGDSLNDSIVDNISVFTNVLGDSAGCSLKVRYPTSNLKTLAITGTNKFKHVFRNIDIPADMFSLELDWSTYSETNPCFIKSIIVNGHTRSK